MNRFQAALIHLLVCSVVGVLLFSFFWFVWYPQPLFAAVGGLSIFLLVLIVDIVLGPLLTLVVYKKGKSSLKFDLGMIGLVQIAALIYGVYTLSIGRPAYIAATGKRFDVVQMSEIDSAASVAPWFGPIWVGTKFLDDPKAHEKLLFSGFNYFGYSQTHVPLDVMRDKILSEAKTIATLKSFNAGAEANIDAWLAAKNTKAEEVRYQPLKASAEDMAVIVDAKTAKVIGIAPFKPWP